MKYIIIGLLYNYIDEIKQFSIDFQLQGLEIDKIY